MSQEQSYVKFVIFNPGGNLKERQRAEKEIMLLIEEGYRICPDFKYNGSLLVVMLLYYN